MYGKISKIKNFWLYMPTTKGRWRSKVNCNLLFKNAKNEKHFSFYRIPRMWTMAISASLRYWGKECMRIQETSIVLQIQVNGFKSKDGNGNLIIAFHTQL
jgi:hypothetical protein